MFAMFAPTPETVDREGANRFVDALAETAEAVWLQAAATVQADAESRSRLLDVILSHAERLRLYDDLWHLSDVVETAAWYALPEWYRAPRTASDTMTRHHAVEGARLAAYAVLLRAHLTVAEFDLLYAPFHEVMQGGLPRHLVLREDS